MQVAIRLAALGGLPDYVYNPGRWAAFQGKLGQTQADTANEATTTVTLPNKDTYADKLHSIVATSADCDPIFLLLRRSPLHYLAYMRALDTQVLDVNDRGGCSKVLPCSLLIRLTSTTVGHSQLTTIPWTI
ncbi:expressed unknown protein [Seminavis robusta]|uniref:Uncharacterized protein n=1 Tax=Seminavis robusta TaxID=568900 RepID=A0A9N8I0Q5_9STRA|nr:expressed unknown protein [Seminavis robusta]|eukprot:Sro2824_g338022.1  (131) ;mRNA; r:9155-9547